MTSGHTLVVGIEDLATAGVVAVAAAHIAQAHHSATIVLLHVLDAHMIASGIAVAAGYALPLRESPDEGERVLSLAEEAVRAEFAAVRQPVPTIRRVVADGPVATAIEHTSQEHGAAGIVLGARRPHAFGRLTHPDVRAHVATHAGVPVHVVPLHATETTPPREGA